MGRMVVLTAIADASGTEPRPGGSRGLGASTTGRCVMVMGSWTRGTGRSLPPRCVASLVPVLVVGGRAGLGSTHHSTCGSNGENQTRGVGKSSKCVAFFSRLRPVKR